MSIERELLEKVISGDNKGDFFINYDLYKEIHELLAKPKREPVVWQVIGIAGFMYVYNKPRAQVYEHHTVNALYTSPPKREPLSDGEITTNTPKTIPIGERLAFHAGIRWAEHQHGIGGGE